MDSQQQQYCLKWNSFGSNLATSFANLWNSESLADVTLYCEGRWSLGFLINYFGELKFSLGTGRELYIDRCLLTAQKYIKRSD